MIFERDLQDLTRIRRENRVEFEFGREMQQRGRRGGRRVQDDQADGARFRIGAELGLGNVPGAGRVVIVRSADQLDKDHQGRREDRGYRAMTAFCDFGCACQNRLPAVGSLPIVMHNAIAVQGDCCSSRIFRGSTIGSVGRCLEGDRDQSCWSGRGSDRSREPRRIDLAAR